MKQDLYNNVTVKRTIAPVAVGTTGTGKTGKPIDRQGYGGVLFTLSYGAITATNATFTVTILEGDVTSSMTSVADADLIGTEAAAGLGQGTPRADDVLKNVAKKIGYKGTKRYVAAKIVSTITAAAIVGADALLFNPGQFPAA